MRQRCRFQLARRYRNSSRRSSEAGTVDPILCSAANRDGAAGIFTGRTAALSVQAPVAGTSGCECKPGRAQPVIDGTTHVVFQPLELLEKLSALIPAPRAHLVRYSGILAPAAKWRLLVVPAGSGADRHACGQAESSCVAPLSAPNEQWALECSDPSATLHPRNYYWAELMKRVWSVDVLECPRCLGRMRIVAAIHAPSAVRKILDCLDLPSRAPPVAPAVSSPLPTDPS